MTLESVGQSRVTLPVHHTLNGETNGFGWSDQYRQLLGPREACVHQIAAKEQVVLYENGENHDRTFAPLALVDGHRSGQSQFREIGES